MYLSNDIMTILCSRLLAQLTHILYRLYAFHVSLLVWQGVRQLTCRPLCQRLGFESWCIASEGQKTSSMGEEEALSTAEW